MITSLALSDPDPDCDCDLADDIGGDDDDGSASLR